MSTKQRIADLDSVAFILKLLKMNAKKEGSFFSFDLSSIKNLYSKNEIKTAICRYIMEQDLSFPLKHNNCSNMVGQFNNLLKTKTMSLRPDTSVNFDGINNFQDEDYLGYSFFDNHHTGAIAGYFHESERMNSRRIHKPLSPMDAWHDSVELSRIISVNYDKFNLKSVSYGLDYGYISTSFNVGIAKAVYDMFQAVNVLDLSSGHGDRYAAARLSSYVKKYVGVDPRSKAQEAYKMQQESYDAIAKDDFQSNFIESGFEDDSFTPSDYCEEGFDLAFTSTPYFDLEDYSSEDNQSIQQFPTLRSWLDGFLFKSMKKAVDSLKDGGFLVFTLKDYNKGKKRIEMCQPLIDYMATLDGVTFEGYFGYQYGKKSKDSTKAKATKIEPMWVFRKGGNPFQLPQIIKNYLNSGAKSEVKAIAA